MMAMIDVVVIARTLLVVCGNGCGSVCPEIGRWWVGVEEDRWYSVGMMAVVVMLVGEEGNGGDSVRMGRRD